MRPNYDTLVWNAKDAVNKEIYRLTQEQAGVADLAARIDDLNAAWDALTDALVRQRDERDTLISELISRLAEAKKITP